MNFCFPDNILVAAAIRFKVLKKSISIKIAVYIKDRKLQPEKT